MKIVSLEELGNNLPIPSKDHKRQSFKFKSWRMPEEKKIGELKAKYKHLGRFVREVFDFMLAEFDGKAWESMETAERKLMLNQMPWANVFYLYCYLRVEAMGNEMKMETMKCRECEAEIKDFIADLNSLEVKIAGRDDDGKEVQEPREFDYKLKHPFTVGEVEVNAIRFGYTPWDAMERLAGGEKNQGSIKEAMLAASLVGAMVEGQEKPITLEKGKVLVELSKKDIEGYYDALDEHNGGPIMGLDIECGSCGAKNKQALNWSYEYFFGSSSL